MDDTIGGALQNFNLEAVQEFKIQTMQYKAEYGRSSGGVLRSSRRPERIISAEAPTASFATRV